MQFTPVWIITFCVYLLCSFAIVFLAKFTAKPVDSYNFSFKRMFPFEVINRNEKSLPYRILLCVFVAASFAPLFNLFTSYGKIANVEALSIAICCIFGLASICFAFLHYFDATHTMAHLVLFVFFVCLTLLGNALAAINAAKSENYTYKEIQKGNIVVGEELKTVLDGLVKDLDDDRFIFDEKPGQLRIEFIETFCKHTKSPFNGQPFILELWEKAILQVAYGFKYKDSNLRRFNEVLLLIARKNGKTTFVAGIDLAEFFLSQGGVYEKCRDL